MINERLLTVEDANSIIEHFSDWSVDYYTVDTRLLTTPDTSFAWDFIDVYRVSSSISFKVNNSLWTGGFRVLDSNVSSPSVSVSDGTITVSKTGLEWVVLLLEISPQFNHGEIFELDYTVEYTPVIRPFYEPITLTMGYLDGETPVTGLSVTDKTGTGTCTTDNDGLITVTDNIQSRKIPNKYTYILESVNNQVTVDYKFLYKKIRVELPIVLNNPVVYRDKVNHLEFEFLLDNEYNMPAGIVKTGSFRLRVNGVYYDLVEVRKGVRAVDLPVGLGEYLDMTVVVGGNTYLEDYSVDFHVPTVYESFSTASDLKTELESDDCAGTVLFTGTVLDTMINIEHDVLVRCDGNVSSSLDNVFTVSDGAVLSLEVNGFTGKGLVDITDGSVVVTGSGFNHCASSIFTGTGDLKVDNSSFNDNYNCIDIDGDVTLQNVSFDLADTDYLDTSTPAFVRCYQDLSVDYCQFNLDLHGLTSLGLSYVMLYLGREGTVNNISNSELQANETFPTRQNHGTVDVESDTYHFTGDGNRCIVWTVQGTNTVYSNKLIVEFIGED